MQILCLLNSITGHKMIFVKLVGNSYSNRFTMNKHFVFKLWEENSGPFCLGLNALCTDVWLIVPLMAPRWSYSTWCRNIINHQVDTKSVWILKVFFQDNEAKTKWPTLFRPYFHLTYLFQFNTQWVSFPNELLISWSCKNFFFNPMLIIYSSTSGKLKEISVSINDHIFYRKFINDFFLSQNFIHVYNLQLSYWVDMHQKTYINNWNSQYVAFLFGVISHRLYLLDLSCVTIP